MFQFIRRVSASFLPRPDRPWGDDATSHAPTIGRKRRHSVTEPDRDGYASASKRSKIDPLQPDTESPVEDPTSPAEGQDVKGVTKGVKEVDLEEKDNVEVEVASSIRPEGVPLPDSPSGSPEPGSESPEPEPELAPPGEVEQTKNQEHPDGNDSVASSEPGDDTEGAEPVTTTTTDISLDKTVSAQQVAIAVHSDLHETPEVLEVNA